MGGGQSGVMVAGVAWVNPRGKNLTAGLKDGGGLWTLCCRRLFVWGVADGVMGKGW